MTTLLIDADMMIYRAAFSKEVATEVEPGYWTWYCKIDEVKDEINNSIAYLLDKLKADRYKLCLSDDYNFRKDILPEYKDKRTKVKRPIVLKPIREWLCERDQTLMMSGLEGDDVLGIFQTWPDYGDDTIIVSLDKDMKTLPGRIFRDNVFIDVSKEEADYNFLLQTLTGDITDGYSGIPGIGPSKAARILEKEATWEAVKAAYLKSGMTEEDALKQARCARILRYEDYDFDAHKPILWSP